MIQSKAWNWNKVNEPFWKNPAREVYYYLYRWKRENFSTLLDLGCGVGRHTILFAEHGFNVTAFDLSESGLKQLRKEIDKTDTKQHISVKLGDITNLPFLNDHFDCILAYHSIYHTDSLGIAKALSEIKRVLKKKGEALVTFNAKNNPSFQDIAHQKIDANTIMKMSGYEKGIPHYYVDETDLEKLLKDFEILNLCQIESISKNFRSSHYFVHLKN